MNKITKKGIASIMAIATLTTSSVGITASAATASGGYYQELQITMIYYN